MNILITGTSKGLGQALGLALYEQGHNVIGIARTEQNQPFITYRYDIQDDREINTLIYNIISSKTEIDILINNAGNIIMKELRYYNLNDIDNIINTNIRGPFILTQHIIDIMISQKQGYIINIGSTRSITSAPNKSLYSMSKFALRALTQSINLEYNQYGIYSTLVCPGEIDESKDTKIHYEDIIKTVNYLLSMPQRAKIPEIIIGGQL